MVASEPYLGDGIEMLVLCYLLRDEVTVVVDDGHLRCVFVIELLRRLGLEQKVFVHEFLHIVFVFLVFG